MHRHLNYPIVLTTESLFKDFSGLPHLRLLTTSAIEAGLLNPQFSNTGSVFDRPERDTAVIMVSQGGDGKAKAICLTNGQIIAAIEGKVQLHNTDNSDVFLAWSGLDYISNLVEVHLHAVFLSATQVFVPYHLAISDPLRFLKSLEKYQISYTHIPNFFLKQLVTTLHGLFIEVRFVGDPAETTFDFSKLKALITQGTLNNQSTNDDALKLFSKYNAPPRFLRPGFGMTEFCGSAIYNIINPTIQPATPMSQSFSLAGFLQAVDPQPNPTPQNVIGRPIPTLSVRIVDEDQFPLGYGEVGMLELGGPCVFTSYYNDPQRTSRMFTQDGWFRTGDLATFDDQGRIILTGRFEDLIILRGIQHRPQGLQNYLLSQNIPGVKEQGIAIFSFRPKDIAGLIDDWKAAGVREENLVVIYATKVPHNMVELTLDTEHRLVKTILHACGMMPFKVLGVEDDELPKTKEGLGRASNMLAKRKFLRGGFGI
jgi:acyl-CoA synthetase (AMP-forming)/AMP-acid ligase II